jgi:t-SNARE complex subunit (syntaxin)
MLRVIEEEDIKQEQEIQIEKLEKDIQIINETMKLLNEIYSENNNITENIVDNIATVDEDILQSNTQLLSSTKNQKEYIKNTIALTGIAVICINLPIGLAYGINVFIASSTLTIAGVNYLLN